jgi:hypothetical protein
MVHLTKGATADSRKTARDSQTCQSFRHPRSLELRSAGLLRAPNTRPLEELGGLGAAMPGWEQVDARRRNRGGNFDLQGLDHRKDGIILSPLLAQL